MKRKRPEEQLFENQPDFGPLYAFKHRWKPVKNDGSVYFFGIGKEAYFIKRVSPKKKELLYSEAKSYASLPASIQDLFVQPGGYYPNWRDGKDYFVTVAPVVDGFTFWHPHKLPSSISVGDALPALLEVLRKMFAVGFTHQDLHGTNYLIGVSEDEKTFVVYLLDPGCWDARENPYLSMCTRYLARPLPEYSESSRYRLLKMLDAVTSISCLLFRENDSFEAANRCIETCFGWKIDLRYDSWMQNWSKEVVRSVCVYMNEVHDPVPSG